MVGPSSKRKAVHRLQEELHVSERRACSIASQHRSSQRYRPRQIDLDELLVVEIKRLSLKHPRYGWRRILALLRRAGWELNHKKMRRIWKSLGLQVKKRTRKRRKGNGFAKQILSLRPNHVWALDFAFDTTERMVQFKIMPVVDEFTKEVLAIQVDRSITSQDVCVQLELLQAIHGAPSFLRMDNGPEFISKTLAAWCQRHGSETMFIDPGSPWQNGIAESFNDKIRDESLNLEEFATLLEAKVVIEDFRREYNQYRPHSAIGYLTPAEYGTEERNKVEMVT